MRIRSHQIEHSGITTSYYDEGEDADGGPVLLLLHGFTGGKLDFHDQLPSFTDRFRVIAPDNRGHGESSNTGNISDYTIDQLVEDLHGFIQAMGLHNIHLLGHSLGGMVVMRYALKYPARLSSVILMDTTAMPLDVPKGTFGAMREMLEQQGAKGLVELMKKAPVTDEVRNGINHLGEAEHWRRIEEKLGQMDVEAYAGLSTEIAGLCDLTPALAAITCPVTVIVGSADKPFLAPSKAMAAVIPNARLIIIPEASHCPQYENAQAWEDALNKHLGLTVS